MNFNHLTLSRVIQSPSRRVATAARRAWVRWRTRQALSGVDQRTLRDVGVIDATWIPVVAREVAEASVGTPDAAHAVRKNPHAPERDSGQEPPLAA